MNFSDKIIEVLSIDTVIFGFDNDHLSVLLVQHAEGISKGRWALPGGWIRYNEALDKAAHRLLSDLTGLPDIYLEQVGAFGEIDRFPDKRVITIAYSALIRASDYSLTAGFTASDARWFNLSDRPDLPYDHNQILQSAHQQLKSRVKTAPVGFNLLSEKFTLLQLQRLYEEILQTTLDKSNFRRKMLKMKLLKPSAEKQEGVNHRAAQLYSFDPNQYENLKNRGFVFEV